MSRLIYVLVGFLFVSGGVLTAVYIMVNKAEEKSVENNAYPFEERLKIAEELLSQSSKKSSQKHYSFSLSFLPNQFLMLISLE
ncbi:MAG: hypothetical protein IPO06_28880 [Leptospiraceae bacterium]|nr:hypothetical protein [Leptospiraceae bacterium]